MEAKHTPGPWKVDKELTSRSGEWLIAMDAGDKGRGIAIAETRVATGAELANARLIAAAPELLEALQLIADTDPVDAALDPQRAVRIAQAAIAKATQ